MNIGEKTYTAADLWELSHTPEYANKRVELIDGAISEMTPAGGKHGTIAMRIGRHVDTYAHDHQLGYTTAAETGYALRRESDARDTVLAPDVGFVARDRLPNGMPDGYIPLAPDLAVEVVSPNDRATDIQHKTQIYLEYGVRVVWVVYPDTRSVVVHTTQGAITLTADDTLDGGEVLPGFTLAVKAIFN